VIDPRLERARSFGKVAEAYELGRPGYPDEAVRWLVGEEPRRVVDVGAGTGKLTRQLIALGHDVTAVEPSAEMLHVLSEAVTGARAVQAGAESMPLPDGSADIVVSAQAFHWFDQPVALTEIARILRPDGALGLVWNMRNDADGWMARLSELIGSEVDVDLGKAIAESGLFAPVENATFAMTQSMDRGALLASVLSRSAVAILESAEQDRILSAVARLYDEVADPPGSNLVMPYVTYAFRTTRTAPPPSSP
jgi:SAM-dependent methyltransferase